MLRNRFPLFFQHGALTILNEVLSLNAQECFSVNHFGDINIFLNEVLSLNAQELRVAVRVACSRCCSSMKS